MRPKIAVNNVVIAASLLPGSRLDVKLSWQVRQLVWKLSHRTVLMGKSSGDISPHHISAAAASPLGEK